MTERVHVITGVERRRRFTESEKRKVVAESMEPGATASAVARKYGLSHSVIFLWRKQYAPCKAMSADLPSEFSRIELRREEQNVVDQPIYVHLNGEVIVEFPPTVSARELAGFIRELGRSR